MFSVIIPLYNKAPFIQRAINSVLAQTYSDYEIIVVNDGTTDGGEEIVQREYGDQIHLIHQFNQGVSIARNNGIAQASFPWIAFLDADDFWHPDYLKLVTEAIIKYPETGIIGSHYSTFQLEENPNLRANRINNYFHQAVKNTLFFTSATVVKREFFETNPGFAPKIKLGEDIDVWIRASLFFKEGLYIQNTLVHYEQEDLGQATKKRYNLHETLIPKLLQKDYYFLALKNSRYSYEEFNRFKVKWIYFTIFPHFALKENQNAIRQVLSELPSRYFLIRGIYKLPFPFLNYAFQSRPISIWFRKYLKFCFRFIYR